MSAAPATDFNDMMIERGNAAVRKAIDNAIATEPKKPLSMVRVDLLCATNIQCTRIRWLWPGFLAKGKLHVIAGDAGVGKSTVAIALASVVSAAGSWPDGTTSPIGNVLIWSGEDDPADTLVPRLKVAGADLERIFFITGTRENGETRPFDPAKDLVPLQVAAEQCGNIALIIVDPVVNAVTGDSHNNTEVRRGLQPLVDIGAQLDAAIIGITHFSKGSGGRNPTDRVIGSVAFGALARIVMVAAKVRKAGQEHPQRVMVRSKSNIGTDEDGFAYTLEQVEFDGMSASRVVWGAELIGSARDLLAEDEPETDSSLKDAPGFLAGLLANGPMPSITIFKDAQSEGYSKGSMHRAKRKIGVIASKSGMDGGWSWRLPFIEGVAQPSEDAALDLATPSTPSAPSAGTELVEL